MPLDLFCQETNKNKGMRSQTLVILMQIISYLVLVTEEEVAEHPVFVHTEEQEDVRDCDSSHRDLLSQGFGVNGVTLYF